MIDSSSEATGWRLAQMRGRVCLAKLACALLCVAFTEAACAGTIRHDRADSSYTSLAASYPSVGTLTWGSWICSATLIEPDWVLSAGHCLDEPGYTADQWTFSLSDSGGGTHIGAAKYLHPDWVSSGGDLNSGSDIALLRLGSNETTVTPATINSANTNEVGQTATHVGYGRSGTGSTGMNTAAGTKRAGNNVVDLTGDSVSGFNDKVLFEDFDSGLAGDNWSGSQTQLNLEYLIASGDSGGPMFIDFGSGEVVAGVHSFISSVDGNTNADYGDIAGSTRVSSYSSWISSTIAANDPVAPEPATIVVWLMIGAGLGTLRVRAARVDRQQVAEDC